MVRYASDLKVESGAPVTNFLLDLISILDENGGWEWDIRLFSLGWFLFFALIRITVGKKKGVDWYSLIHAVISGVGGTTCAYLSFHMGEQLTGFPEPMGSIQCGGPLTSLHRVLPTASLGYSVFDLIDGLTLGADFLSHGSVMLAWSLYMCETQKNEFFSPMLIMEMSTIFLALVRAEFLGPTLSWINMVLFAFSFFLFRIVLGPYYWFLNVKAQYEDGYADRPCSPPYFPVVVFVTGMFFNILNAYWFYKILRKMQRKLGGKEGQFEKNDLNETEKAKEE